MDRLNTELEILKGITANEKDNEIGIHFVVVKDYDNEHFLVGDKVVKKSEFYSKAKKGQVTEIRHYE
jgi:hypothetical protein